MDVFDSGRVSRIERDLWNPCGPDAWQPGNASDSSTIKWVLKKGLEAQNHPFCPLQLRVPGFHGLKTSDFLQLVAYLPHFSSHRP